MSLKSRAQQHGQQIQNRQPGTVETGVGPSPIALFPCGPQWAIVDGERVTALGFTDIPGMSLAVICTDPEGGYLAPVPYSDVRLFTELTPAALEALQATRLAPR
jgi:hypothetical protein